ncbi:MAG TPA: DnaJ family domain-containing protein [Polyangiaceae bacterium]
MVQDPEHALVEAQLRAARERGDFDELRGRGKPLQLDDLDHLSPEQRFEALLMRSLGEVPAKVALVREIRACRALIEHSASEQERESAQLAIRKKVNELQRLLNDDR